MFITIAGNIGAGKSALTCLLHEKFGWDPYFESVDDNPYLPDFYGDMNRWAFHLQVYFLSQRLIVYKEISEKKRPAIVNRSIYEDAEIFARNLHTIGKMDDRDYSNYCALFAAMTRYIKPPDLMIYLRASIPTLYQQIKLRGRSFEQNIESEYLENLNIHYEEWIRKYSLGPFLVIDTDEYDFVHDMQKQEELLYKINHAVKKH